MTQNYMQLAKEVNEECLFLSPQEIIHIVSNKLPSSRVLSLSMQIEGLVILDILLRSNISCSYYTIDTGRLPEETHQMFDIVREKYKINLQVYHPQAEKLDQLVRRKGSFSFKESHANREECCFIRKVEPNQIALYNHKVWISGLRREQSAERKNTACVEYLVNKQMFKVNPLFKWSKQEVDIYIHTYQIPCHPLYGMGYKSIGCAPCTRSVREDEPERAGRWWWENSEKKECGLHMKPHQ